jgi:uncharacterized DUF497 family protein
MRLGYDPQKNAWNIRERGLSFDDVALLDWTTATIREDRRQDYGESRFQALVEGDEGKPYVVVFTMRGETMWIISFRRARDRERKSYGQAQET